MIKGSIFQEDTIKNFHMPNKNLDNLYTVNHLELIFIRQYDI